VIDDDHVVRSLGPFNLEPKLLLHRSVQARRSIQVVARRRGYRTICPPELPELRIVRRVTLNFTTPS